MAKKMTGLIGPKPQTSTPVGHGSRRTRPGKGKK